MQSVNFLQKVFWCVRNSKAEAFFDKGTNSQPQFYQFYLESKRVLYIKKLQNFLTNTKTLYKFQRSFEKKKTHSIAFCLPYVTEKIPIVFNSSLLTGMILIDLQKTFDTIDHCLLQQHLPLLEFPNEVIYWLR